jgi:hypothetical protein
MYDGQSPYVWRQGIKHDCARVMELTREDDRFVNGLGETMELEDALIYGLVKSSDVKKKVIRSTGRYVIVPTRKIGEDAAEALKGLPLLHNYLSRHRELLDSRKSSIYRNQPPFSIFGIGDYSFQPFKVIVSGLYKQPRFALALSPDDRPLMADDTCYFLGFDSLDDAACVWALLNGPRVQGLLAAITFNDAKRPFTKEMLMRIDLTAVAHDTKFQEIEECLNEVEEGFDGRVAWQHFMASLHRHPSEFRQLVLL